MKTCYIYARTATVTQIELATGKIKSIEKQIGSCQKFAQENKFHVLKVFSEMASGADYKRKELQQLLKACQKTPVNAVLILDIDRLSRSAEDFARINLVLSKQNIHLISVHQGNLSENSIGRFLGSLGVAFAQFELERSKAR